MENSFVIISLILVAIVFVPFFYMNYLGKKETKKLKAICKANISRNELKISQQEIWADHYIGIDSDQKKLLYLQGLKSDNKETLIDLKYVTGCNKIEKSKTIKIKDKKESRLERLVLVIVFKNGTNTLLNFYDSDKNYSEDLEANRLEKWKQLVVANISESLKLNRAV